MLKRWFAFESRSASWRGEGIAGLTTFMTMAYILFVNPAILEAAGMDRGAVLIATALSAGVVSIAMGLIANLPVALAPGMGLNAFFAFSVVGTMGVPWPVALGIVFLASVLFFVVTVTPVRALLLQAIPVSMKHAITAGIGLFITLIGLKLSGITGIHLDLSAETMNALIASGGRATPGPTETAITLGAFTSNVVLTLVGVIVIAVLMARGIGGAFLTGITVVTVLAWVGGDIAVPEGFSPLSLPDFSNSAVFALDIAGALDGAFVAAILTFAFVVAFDSMGTLVGTVSRAGLADSAGHAPGLERALGVASAGAVFGSLMGTSPVTAYVESAAGIGAGGRTGITAIVVGLLFLAALFLTPVVALVPAVATAPVLIMVGALMLEGVRHVNFDDATDFLPAFAVIATMPFTGSIATGIAFGLVLLPLVKTAAGRRREVHWLVWVLAALVVARYAWLGSL